MANEYSTIQQHQPLRTPASFDKQGKALIVQLDEIFDDIYRRFGRLRMEDMGKTFRKRIEDDEGNISEINQEIGQITIEVGNKYDKVSGIAIDTNGIDITGSKYVKVRSGGSFEVDATNFKIDSTEKKVVAGSWKFDDNGLYYDNGSGSSRRRVNIEYSYGYLRFGFTEGDGASSTGGDILINARAPVYTVVEPGQKYPYLWASLMGATEVYFDHVQYSELHQNSSKFVKHNIEELPSFGEKLDELRPVSFVYNGDDKKRFGLIHEETISILPEICSGGVNDSPERKAIDYVELVPILLKEIQSLRKRVAALEAMNHV